MLCKDVEFIEKVQSLLDAGNSRNKVAEILNVHHSKVDRVLTRGLVEIYTAFDEEDTKHLYQNFEWLWEEDELERLCDIAFDGLFVNISEALGDNFLSVGRYVRENYGDLRKYLKDKNKEYLTDLFYKRCLGCGKYHRIKFFSKKKGSPFGLYARCNVCQAKKIMEHYYKDKEKFRVYARNWQSKNKEKMKRNYHKRLARKRSLPDDLTANQLAFTLLEFENQCFITGDTNTHLDHVIPLAVGHGGTTYGNMIPLRADLNQSKNDNNIFEWFEANRQRFDLSQERFDIGIAWLASANAMTIEEYRKHVYWCHENKR
jgi:hypothetical protein